MNGIKIIDKGSIELTGLDMKDFTCEAHSEVDGTLWYTIMASREVREWITTQDTTEWHLHIGSWSNSRFNVINLIDVSSDIYMLIRLKFNG